VHDVELFAENVRFIAHADGSDVETGLVGIDTEVFENRGSGLTQAVVRFGITDEISIVEERPIAAATVSGHTQDERATYSCTDVSN